MVEMIWINVWDRVLCRFVRTLVSRNVAKAMPHIIVTSTALLTCGPATHTGLPPIPPLLPSINIPLQPVLPPPGPKWTYVPESDYPLSPPEGGWFAPGDFLEVPFNDNISDSRFLTGIPISADTPPLGKQSQPTPTVSEPSALGWLLGACAFLVMLRRSQG